MHAKYLDLFTDRPDVWLGSDTRQRFPRLLRETKNQCSAHEFEHRVEQTKLAFAEQGLNAELYYGNKNFARNVSLVPTSAISGEGLCSTTS